MKRTTLYLLLPFSFAIATFGVIAWFIVASFMSGYRYIPHKQKDS